MVVGGFAEHSGPIELVEVSECFSEVSVEVSGLVSALVAASLKGSSP